MKTQINALALILACAASARAAEPVVIGWTGPLTGNCAVVGIDSLAAVRLVIDEANREGGAKGRPIKLVAEDDGYQTVRAVSSYQKLVHQDGARMIIANTYGGVFATARDALRDGVLVIDPLDCNDEIAALPENTLCLATRTESISAGFADQILRDHARTVLLLVEESDGWMQLVARNTRRLLEEAGVTVLEEDLPAAAASFKSSLVRAKRAGAAAVVILGNDQMGAAPREMRQLGFEAQVYGVGSILSPGFQALAGGALEGAYVSSWLAPRTPDYHRFAARFEEKYHRRPALELASLPSHDAAAMLVHCLREAAPQAGEPQTSELRGCLLAQRGYPGLAGRISFDADGAVRSIRERLYRYVHGELAPL